MIAGAVPTVVLSSKNVNVAPAGAGLGGISDQTMVFSVFVDAVPFKDAFSGNSATQYSFPLASLTRMMGTSMTHTPPVWRTQSMGGVNRTERSCMNCRNFIFI